MPPRKRRSLGRQRPSLTPPSGLRTLRELQDELHRGIEANPALDALAVALSVVDRGRAIGENDIVAGTTPAFTLATALFAAVREVTRPYPLISTEESPFLACVPGAEILLSQAGGVFSDDYIEAFRQGPHRDQARWSEALRLNMIWTLAENGIFQGNMFTRLAIALVLTGLVGYRGLGAAPERTNALFSRHLGIGAYEYVLVVLVLWAYARHDSLISTANIIQEGPKKAQLTRAVANVVEALSRRIDRFRDLSDSPSFSTYTGKALPSALFQRWPLIQINESQFVVSAHPFLKVQLSSKFLTKALALARAEAPREEQGRTAYSVFVGQERLEPFVRELCDVWRPGNHVDEYAYLRGSNALGPDRVVFERHGSGEVAILLQLKAKLVVEATHFGASAEALTRDLRLSLSGALAQSLKFLPAIARAGDPGHPRLNPHNEETSRRILACRHICLVGLVPEIPALLTMSDIRALLLQETVATLDPDERGWFERNSGRITWHIMGLDEFLLFLSLPDGERHLYKRLSGYFRDATPDRPFVDSAGRFPMSFRSYLASKYGDQASLARTGLNVVTDTLMEDMNRFFLAPNTIGPTSP